MIFQIVFFSPVFMLFVAVAAVTIARLYQLPKRTVARLAWQPVLFAVAGAVASLVLLIIWMIWYENTTGYGAGNAPLAWIFFYGPLSAALGQLCALLSWWFKRPSAETRDSAA